MDPLYPLTFRPILKRLIWGGRRLGTLMGKPLGGESDYAESWEISDHRDDVSVVASGPLVGTTLRTLIQERGRELLGTTTSQFPLLIKFLDANQVLSVQVHPDDALARSLVDDNGKTEAWVILHADPGSLIYAGLNRGVDREQFARALATGDVDPLLHRFEPRTGDAILIPAGTVHAIGAGIVLAEIQQMSDATFRVHDWGRTGADGKPRPLHLDEALQSIDFHRGPVLPVRRNSHGANTVEPLVQSDYFAIDRLHLDQDVSVGAPGRFTILMGLDGEAQVESGRFSATISRGQTVLLPASCGSCRLTPEPSATVLCCTTP